MLSSVQRNATMATASMTTASHSGVDHNPSMDQSQEESIEKLKSNLARYTRSNDRRMVLRSLKDVKFLSYIPLEVPNDRIDIPISEIEKEVSEEKMVLNDVLLKPRDPANTNDVYVNAGANSGCIMMLKTLVRVLSDKSALKEKTLYERLLIRLARTTSSADAYFQINSMMGSTELIVRQLSSEHQVKATATNVENSAANGNENAIQLNLYNSGGQVHMILDMACNFGLFRKSDATSCRPWIIVKGKVHERANLSTNESFRCLNVQTPSLY